MRDQLVNSILLTCSLVTTMTSGCRLPKLFLKPTSGSLHYDTAFEQELSGKPVPAEESLQYDYKWRYRETLSEPVSLIDYKKDEYSKWNVLFATNRVPVSQGHSSSVEFGKDYSTQLTYGHCQVELTVPTKADLKAAEPDGTLGKVFEILPQPWQQEVTFDETAYRNLQATTPVAKHVFYTELAEQLELSRQNDVLVFVHGFNVDFPSAVGRVAQIARDMPFNGAIIAYSWPSQGGVDNYQRDGNVVNDSIPAFKQFLTDLKGELPADSKLNIVVHSMGNRLVMRSLSQLQNAEELSPQWLENIVLCAPDVGVDEFKRVGPAVVASAKHATLYRCLNDSALIASSYRNGEERAGGSLAPVILNGMDTVECAVIDTSILGHSYYGSNPHMLRDLFCLLKEATPAAERPWMKKQKIPFQGDMWIIADWPVQLDWTWHTERLPSRLRTGELANNSNPQVLQSSWESGKVNLNDSKRTQQSLRK